MDIHRSAQAIAEQGTQLQCPVEAHICPHVVTEVRSARYELIVVVEAAASICNHLCARVARRAPSSYGECFLIPGEIGLVPKELAMRLAKMAGFRNRYARVDNARVLQIMRDDLGDLEQYLEWVEVFLATVPGVRDEGETK